MNQTDIGELIFKFCMAMGLFILISTVVFYRVDILELLMHFLAVLVSHIVEEALFTLVALVLMGTGILVAWLIRKGMRRFDMKTTYHMDLLQVLMVTAAVTALGSVLLKVGFDIEWIKWDWILGVALVSPIVYAVQYEFI